MPIIGQVRAADGKHVSKCSKLHLLIALCSLMAILVFLESVLAVYLHIEMKHYLRVVLC